MKNNLTPEIKWKLHGICAKSGSWDIVLHVNYWLAACELFQESDLILIFDEILKKKWIRKKSLIVTKECSPIVCVLSKLIQTKNKKKCYHNTLDYHDGLQNIINWIN